MHSNAIDITLSGTFSIPYDYKESEDHARLSLDLWENLPASICERTYQHEKRIITVQVEWTAVVELLRQQYKISSLLHKTSRISQQDLAILFKTQEVPCRVTISGDTAIEKGVNSHYQSFVECFLYDVFLILNLSVPGSADFYNVGFIDTDKSFKSLQLSAYYLELLSQDKSPDWPKAKTIDVTQVEHWYNGIHRPTAQVAENPVESALFSLLHICRSRGEPGDIVWIFYGFESLFKTRVGENFSALVERISLLLSPDEKQKAVLRKQLRKMYDFRSSFVHGGLQVIHPMHHDGLDDRINSSYGNTVQLSIYGTKLLTACIQKFAMENWKSISFPMTICADNIGSENAEK
ncbi:MULTISPECIES: hypothetical protein [Oxalobacteraceae]|uniref:hypothetical protein n=1 Tax=Herminiimonas sp. Marseille-P9896 TaxID=2742211 RepID=UPI00158DB068|nr:MULTISPECIES: hypothetical protein [Oxalobacteraceae]